MVTSATAENSGTLLGGSGDGREDEIAGWSEAEWFTMTFNEVRLPDFGGEDNLKLGICDA